MEQRLNLAIIVIASHNKDEDFRKWTLEETKDSKQKKKKTLFLMSVNTGTYKMTKYYNIRNIKENL